MSPEVYCQQIVQKSSSSFAYSFRFLQPAQRAAMTALYAFCREVDDVVDDCQDVGVAAQALGWWRQEVLALFMQRASHPVTRALQPHVITFGLEQAHFLALIDGMAMDLAQPVRYVDFASLELYCYRAASVVGLLTAAILGYQDRQTLVYARDLGIALQLINIIRDVGEDAQRGRVYLPLEDLQRFGVSVEDILHRKNSAEFQSVMRFQAARADEFYQRALASLPRADRKRQQVGLMMGAVYHALLREIAADGFLVLQHKIRLPALRKLWIVWRTWLSV